MTIVIEITCDTRALTQAVADTLVSASGSASLVFNFNAQLTRAGLSVSASFASSSSTIVEVPSDSSSTVKAALSVEGAAAAGEEAALAEVRAAAGEETAPTE